MSSYQLRSHEDLAGYLNILHENLISFQDSSSLIPSFSEDPQTIIQDLLSETMSTRKKALKVTKIAKKFYKVQEDSCIKIRDLIKEINSLQEEINHLVASLTSQEKEIKTKDKRIDAMEHELQETEKEFRDTLKQLQSLRTENKVLKESKEQRLPRQKTNSRFEEIYEETIKELKQTVEDYKQEIEKKTAENTSLEKKVKETVAFAHSEKLAAERIRVSLIETKREKEKLAEKLEDVENKLEVEKGNSVRLEEEVIKLKNRVENLAKEHEREKFLGSGNSGRMSTEFVIDDFNKYAEQMDDDTFPSYRRKSRKMEPLSEWITEDNQYNESSPSSAHAKSKTMFILSTPTVSYQHFSFGERPNSGFMLYHADPILILANYNKKNSLQECKIEAFSILNTFRQTQLSQELFSIAVPAWYAAIDPISLQLQKFPNSSDPLKCFFILTCKSLVLNSPSKIGSVSIEFWYRKVKQAQIPFNLWSDFLKSQQLS